MMRTPIKIDGDNSKTIQRQVDCIDEAQSASIPCPNCGQWMNFYEGIGVKREDFDFGAPSTRNEDAQCTSCKEHLSWVTQWPFPIPMWIVKKSEVEQ